MAVPAHALAVLVVLAAVAFTSTVLGAEDPLKASISGYLFCDRCNNRLNDTGDYPLAGVKVSASCRYMCAKPAFCDINTDYTTRTDNNGYYEFKNMIDTYESSERDTGAASSFFFCSVHTDDLSGGSAVPPPCNAYSLCSRLTDLCDSNRLGLRYNFEPHAGDVITTGRSCFAERPSPGSCQHHSRPQVKAGQDIFASTSAQPVELHSIPYWAASHSSRMEALTVSGDSMYWAELVSENWSWQTATWRFLSAASNATERIPTWQMHVLSDDVLLPWGAYRPDSFAVDYTADQIFVFVSNCVIHYQANEGDVVIYATGQSLGGTQPVIYKAVEGPHMRPETRATITSLQIDTSAKPTPILYWIETRTLRKSTNGSMTDYLNTSIKRGALSLDRTGHLRDVQVLFERTMACGGPYDFQGMPVTQLQVDTVNKRLYALHNAYYNTYRQDKKSPASYLSVYDIGAASSIQLFPRTLLRPLGVFVDSFRIDVYSDPPLMYAVAGSGVMYKLQLKCLDRDIDGGTVAIPPYLLAPHDYTYVDNFDIFYDPACLKTILQRQQAWSA
eukprot:jgi/Chlat1/4459/Chrsp29S04565